MVREVLRENNIAATVTKVSDINEIAKEGVLLTPGLIVNGDVKFCGKLPSKAELTAMITGA